MRAAAAALLASCAVFWRLYKLAMIRVLLIACALLVARAGHAAPTPPPGCDPSRARMIVDAILNLDYPEANALLRQWRMAEPKAAGPDFYQATLLLDEAKWAGKTHAQTLNTQALALLQAVSQRLQTQPQRSLDDELLLSMADAFSARVFLDRDAWMKAYTHGKQSRKRLRQVIRQHPNTEDAYLVLGLYEFYTGDLPTGLKGLSYLLDLSGDRKRGLRWLERAAQLAPTAAPEAARVLIDELPLKAPEVCQWLSVNAQLRDRYPGNWRFSYQLQKNYRRCGQPERALAENQRGFEQFRSNRRVRGRFMAQRLLIYRDLGDIAGMKSLRKRFRKPYFDQRLQEAHAARAGKSHADYRKPAPVHNDQRLTLNTPCHAGADHASQDTVTPPLPPIGTSKLR